MKKNLLSVFEGKSFNVDEAKKIAIALERQGFQFYSGMKDRVRTENIQTVFNRMAEEEKKHVRDIEAMLKDPESEWYLDPATEEIVLQYFSEYMKGGIFPADTDAEAAAMELQDEIQAVTLAYNFEKDAVGFYTELVKMAKDPDTRKAFEELVEFEKGHVSTLENLLRMLKSTAR